MSLKKHCANPWLKYIQEGTKTYEGRLYREGWEEIRLLDELTLYNEDLEVRVLVTGLLYFNDFGEAFQELGEKLIPGCKSSAEASELYFQYYSEIDIANNGVVALRLEVI